MARICSDYSVHFLIICDVRFQVLKLRFAYQSTTPVTLVFVDLDLSGLAKGCGVGVDFAQGRNQGVQGDAIPRAPSQYGAPNHRMGAEKSQKCCKYLLQYSEYASERPQVRTWGCLTCFSPRAPSNLVTPLFAS